jgi:hypothetical protein
MKFLVIILLILTSLGHANSQQHYYIYIQSDSQPFYSSIGKQVFSSTASAFVIIPRLKDSVYQVTIGFPGGPDYIFNCVINKKDRGFLLKNFNEKGWGLFNLLTMEVIMGIKVEKPVDKNSNSSFPATNDEFTIILASAVDDPGLRQTELIQHEEIKTAVAKEEIKKHEEIKKEPENKEAITSIQSKSNAVVAAAGDAQIKTPDSAINATATKKDPEKTVSSQSENHEDSTKLTTEKEISVDSPLVSARPLFSKVARTLQYQNKDGMEMIYVDDLLNGEKDTIRIFIPAEPVSTAQPSNTDSKNIATEKKDSQFLDMAISPKKDSPVVGNQEPKATPAENNAVKKDTLTSSIKEKVAPVPPVAEKIDSSVQIDEGKKAQPAVTAKTNTNCKKLATDRDVTNLRSRMIVIKDEDEIVNMALKTFKQKCFTAENIKSLCYVFITDQGKYKLMDAAYPYVSDQEKFSSLSFLLTDTYYLNRFNSLVKQN